MSASPNRSCPQCGAPLALNAQVCSACGSSIPEPPSPAPTQWASSRYSEAPYVWSPYGSSSQSYTPSPPPGGVPYAAPSLQGSKNAAARTRPAGVTALAVIVGFQAIFALLYFLLAFRAVGPVGAVVIGILAGATLPLVVGLWTLRPWAFWTAIVLEALYLWIGLLNLAVSLIRLSIHILPVLIEVVIPLVILICLFAVRNVRAAILGK
jgi:hypothetical protein